MGHIDCAPVSHIWYFKESPQNGPGDEHLSRNLEKVLYFAAYIVLDPGDTGMAYRRS